MQCNESASSRFRLLFLFFTYTLQGFSGIASLKRPLTFLQRRVGGVSDARVLTVLLTTV